MFVPVRHSRYPITGAWTSTPVYGHCMRLDPVPPITRTWPRDHSREDAAVTDFKPRSAILGKSFTSAASSLRISFVHCLYGKTRQPTLKAEQALSLSMVGRHYVIPERPPFDREGVITVRLHCLSAWIVAVLVFVSARLCCFWLNHTARSPAPAWPSQWIVKLGRSTKPQSPSVTRTLPFKTPLVST